MSKPELNIIHSPEAETFLRMVTKGFYDRSYIGLRLFEVMGREWDEMRSWSENLKSENFVQTCTWSIGIWEWVYGFEPDETMTLEERRQRILNRVRGVRPINPEAIRRGVQALAGTETEVHDFIGPYRFEVVLHPKPAPLPFEKILKYIREVKPSHLSYDFRVSFPAIVSTLYVGGAVGTLTEFGTPEQPNTYDFRQSLHIGGTAGMHTQTSAPEAPYKPDFASTLHVGGNAGIHAVHTIPQNPPPFSIQRNGSVCTIIMNPPEGS